MEKSGAEYLWIDLEKNSPDTVKRLCELCPGVTVSVELREKRWADGGGGCYDITFFPSTDNIKMDFVHLFSGEVTRLYQLVSLFQSWTVNRLELLDLGPDDWTELSQSLEILNSVR